MSTIEDMPSSALIPSSEREHDVKRIEKKNDQIIKLKHDNKLIDKLIVFYTAPVSKFTMHTV